MWRFRREPEAQYDGTGEYILSWRMADAPWLLVDELVREDEDVLVVDGGEFIRRGTGTKTVAAQTISAFRDQYLRPKPLPEPPFPPPPASRVARFIHDASGTRTLAVLNAGARGKTISLGLARNPHPCSMSIPPIRPSSCAESIWPRRRGGAVMTRYVFPELFYAAGAPIVVNGEQRLALRWLRASLGLPAPCSMSGSSKAGIEHERVPFDSVRLPGGERLITWSGGRRWPCSFFVSVPSSSADSALTVPRARQGT